MTTINRALDSSESSIHNLLNEMSKQTAAMINGAIECISTRDCTQADKIIQMDADINRLQHVVEEKCLVTIARHQPVASDLRDLISNTHIAVELERIADYAVDIAKLACKLHDAIDTDIIEMINTMGRTSTDMLSRIMLAHETTDEQSARNIAAEDDALDEMEQAIISDTLERLNDPEASQTVQTELLWLTHDLERIGDRITNIAERIVFTATGNILDLNR